MRGTCGEDAEVGERGATATMTFHTYVLAKSFGMSETIAVTETGYERLTNFKRQLFTV